MESTMKTTLDLLKLALANGVSSRHLATELHLSANAFHTAKQRGKLTPELAQALAEHLGVDPVDWIALAAVEAQPPSVKRDALIKSIQTRLGKYMKHAATAIGVLPFVSYTAIAGALHACRHGLESITMYIM
jgi:hypothetical protein